jgi:hypothetical protein
MQPRHGLSRKQDPNRDALDEAIGSGRQTIFSQRSAPELEHFWPLPGFSHR